MSDPPNMALAGDAADEAPAQWPLELGAAAGLTLVALMLYFPFVGIPYFADDYIYRMADPHRGLYRYFADSHDMAGFYRPLQMSWSAAHQVLCGDDTTLMQAGQAALHGLLGGGLLVLMRRWGLPWGPALLAALWFVTHPICVSGVLGNDTFGQIASTLCGCVAIALAFRHGAWCGGQSERGVRGAPLWCALTLALSLLSKESGLSHIGIVLLIVLYWAWRGGWPAARRLLPLGVACAVVLGGYFAWRTVAAPLQSDWGGEGEYDLRLGLNVLVNEGLLLGAGLLPWSTADAYFAFRAGAAKPLVAAGGVTAVWGAFLVWGLVRTRAGESMLGLTALAVCAGVPMVLMNHVSELHSYNLLPFLALLVALAVRGAFLHPRAGARVAAAVVLLLVLSADVWATVRKGRQMQRVGVAVGQMIPQVVEQARKAPRDGRLLLVNQPRGRDLSYSVFLTRDFDGVEPAADWIRRLAQRPDVGVQIMRSEDVGPNDITLVREDTPGGAVVRRVRLNVMKQPAAR
jgi:hypothetical protein